MRKSLLKLFSASVTTYFLFLLLIIPYQSSAVRQEDFRNCDQSHFCKRNRAYADAALADPSFKSPYALLTDTVRFENSVLYADIKNSRNNVIFTIELHALEDSTSRLRINEKNPLKPRYDGVKDFVLVKETRYAQDHVSEIQADGTVIIKFGRNKKIVLSPMPLRIDFFVEDVLVISLNDRGFFNFEHIRKKGEIMPKFVDQSEGGNLVEVQTEGENEEEKGMWEETFKSWTDPKPNGPESVALDISFPSFEHVYGIPEHATSLSLKETRGGDGAYTDPYRLWNLDVFEYELDNPMALYGSIPFMLAHNKDRTVGILWMNAAETWIDVVKDKDNGSKNPIANFFKKTISTTTKTTYTHWISESGIIDLFIFLGPTSDRVFAQYSAITGTTAMPQQFAIAYHQSRWNYINQVDVKEVNAGFNVHDIPYDVIWLDIEHTDDKKYMIWDSGKFPDPLAMQKDLANDGRKLVTIVDPHVKRDAGYHISREAEELDIFVKDASGKIYEGWCWPGSSSWVDFTNPAARSWWVEKFKFDQYKETSENVFIWNDMNEPSVFNGPEITMPKEHIHYGGWEHRDLHNIFGMFFHATTAQGLMNRSDPPKRPFVLSRAFYAGTQQYGAIWTGDNTATWEQLKYSNPMLLTLGISGLPFSGADVGGFFNNPSTELLVRWYQAGAFQPFFRGHAHIDTKRREPWLFGEPTTSQIRLAIRSRYALLPFWYTLFRSANIQGSPIIRPHFVVFPEDEAGFTIEDQFFVGDSLLVHPITTEGATTAEVYFAGTEPYYDYWTHDRIAPGTRRSVDAPLGIIPVYQRGGSIVPRRDRPRRSSTAMRLDPFTLLVALNRNSVATGELYLDDGETYDYTRGGYIHRRFEFSNATLKASAIGVKNTYSAKFQQSIANVRVERVVVLGMERAPKKVIVKDRDGEKDVYFEWEQRIGKVVIKDPAVKVIETGWEIKLII